MDDALASLEGQYGPFLDSALIVALASDFDLSTPEGLASCRATLEAIKTSSSADDTATFDPSGTSSSHVDHGREISETSASFAQSDDTDYDGLSDQLRAVDLKTASTKAIGYSEGDEEPLLEGYDTIDDKDKVQILKEMFPRSSDYAITYTLQKCHGNCNRALEEMLNHAFFDEDQDSMDEDKISAKSVNAFFEDQAKRPKKRKQKKHKRLHELSDLDSPFPSRPISPWELGKQDIEFISSRTGLAPSTVSSLYHQNGASLAKTLVAILELPPSKQTLAFDASLQKEACELGREFPTIAPSHISALVQLTHPSSSAAHELAKAIVSPRNAYSAGSYDVSPKYTPIVLPSEDSDDSWRTLRQPKSLSGSRTSSGMSTPDPNAMADSYGAKAHSAFASASAAWRRGKSDRLMSGAAGYYSQVGRDMAAKRLEATAEAADQLVASQSTSTTVDLHGVSVKDAVRIARQQTQVWWNTKGKGVMGMDGRLVRTDEKERTLNIITGVGRHSEAGRAKIGPAVARMLLQDGWKFEVDDGMFTIIGKK